MNYAPQAQQLCCHSGTAVSTQTRTGSAPYLHVRPTCSSVWNVWTSVILLLVIQAGLLAYSATQHSPTLNEPGHLVAGLSHWKFGRMEVYCVNPPLTHYIAAVPVFLAGYNEDWGSFDATPGARPEFKMGEDFIRANGERSIWLFTIARWACIPICLIGGLICFLWSRELWASNTAGLVSLCLWCFEPNILAHGELITTDCAASAFGLGAGYLFWRWLKRPTWTRCSMAGAALGLALLTKTSWIFLFGLWPLLWAFWRYAEFGELRRDAHSDIGDSSLPLSSIRRSFLQLTGLFALALYLLNLGYGFDGSFTSLKDFTFVSQAFTSLDKSGTPGNRFQNSWLGELPVPVPKQFLRGIDLQKKDFEDYGQPSYLRGQWKDGGWWYYYLYGLAVKTPHGSQLLVLLALVTLVVQWRRRCSPNASADPPGSTTRDLLTLLAPPLTLFVLVSSQLGFNHHIRYILPVFGFAYVFTGITASWLVRRRLTYD